MGKRSHVQVLLTPSVRPSILALALFVGVAANAMTGMPLTGQAFPSLAPIADLITIDDGDAAFSQDKSVEVNFARAHEGDFRYMVKAEGQTTETAPRASWNFTNLEPGTYEAYITWVPFGSNNAQAEYVIMEGETALGNATIDQRSAPTEASFNGVNWKRIGEFTLTQKELRITMIAGTRFSIVDAAGIRKIGGGVLQELREAAPIVQPVTIIATSSSSTPTAIARVSSVFSQRSVQSSRSSARSVAIEAPVSTPIAIQEVRAACGNTVLDKGEECDDGNFKPGDGCTPLCRREFCGDGMVSSGEECEASHAVSFAGTSPGARCGASCRWEYCGDGIVQNNLGEMCDDRNANEQDGCSNTCTTTSLTATPTKTTLAVVQKSIGATETVVRGGKNITLQRFEVRAGGNGSVTLNSISFYAGSTARNAENYTLMIDTDNDTVADRAVLTGISADANGFVSFIDTPLIIGSNQTVLMEIHADISQNPLTDALSLSFAPGTTSGIIAKDGQSASPLNGVSLNGRCNAGSCNIFVTTITPKVFTIRPQGSVFITENTETSSSEDLLSLTIRAQDEGVDLMSLQITSLQNDASTVDRLELYKEGQLTPFAIATATNCGSKEVPRMVNGVSVQTFCATMDNRELVVFANQEVKISIRPRIKEKINQENLLPLQFFIASTPVADAATGRGAVHARGLISGTQLRANNGDSSLNGEIFIGTSVAGPNQDITGGN